MTLEQLKDSLPDYAKDMRLNLGTVLAQTELNEQQLWGTALACAMAAGSPALLSAIAAEARPRLSPAAFAAAQSAATIMGMNNVYYRFLHLIGDDNYRAIPARLRMNAIRTHGVEPADFELWCLAVSAMNNCQACIASHENVVRDKGLTAEAILAAVRIASVLAAVAGVVEAERATAA
jgi:alkyl hydroperoxide reductase subunit D